MAEAVIWSTSSGFISTSRSFAFTIFTLKMANKYKKSSNNDFYLIKKKECKITKL